VVPDGQRAQVPFPAQSPVRPQVVASWKLQLLFGSSPAGTGSQPPVPSQTLHRAHWMPAAHRRQAPFPSHCPSRPQVDWACWSQLLFVSCPATTGRHPPAPLHTWQMGQSGVGSVPSAIGEVQVWAEAQFMHVLQWTPVA
jgi:hypothetical protein